MHPPEPAVEEAAPQTARATSHWKPLRPASRTHTRACQAKRLHLLKTAQAIRGSSVALSVGISAGDETGRRLSEQDRDDGMHRASRAKSSGHNSCWLGVPGRTELRRGAERNDMMVCGGMIAGPCRASRELLARRIGENEPPPSSIRRAPGTC